MIPSLITLLSGDKSDSANQTNANVSLNKINKRMSLHDLIDWSVHKILDLKDAAMGSFVYFLYGRFYQKKSLWKGVVAFFIGTVFAMYLGPVFQRLTGLEIQVTSFLVGMLGMKFTEALISQDYQSFITDYIKSKTNNKI